MRVSSAYRYDFFSSVISKTDQSMFEAQQRVSTGKQILSPSDNPVGTSVSIRARDIKASLAQYSSNISSAKSMLKTTDSALSALNDMLNSAKTIALRGSNGTNSKEAMGSMATSIQQMSTNLISTANTQMADGQYIFAGQSTTTKPFTASNGAITYNGDQGAVNFEVGPGTTVQGNTDGSTLITDLYNAFQKLGSNLSANDPGAISGSSIQQLDDLIKRVNQARGTTGANTQTITDLANQHGRRTDELTQRISDVEDVDMAKAISDYQQANTAYQAALSVTSQASKLSLLDFIK